MTGFVPIDAAERDRIRTQLAENLCVEAGAGTGKTTVLVDRIAEVLRTGFASVDEIAVITFTEAAAAELAARVRQKLEALLDEEAAAEERARIREALSGLHRAHIETIHAFAGELPPGIEPRPASWEVDKAEFLPMGKAREKIHPDQAAFLDRLEELLGGIGGSASHA